jgi:hypothetical protein
MRVFYNGTEAALKRPKVNVALNARDLRDFEKEVATMFKVNTTFRNNF